MLFFSGQPSDRADYFFLLRSERILALRIDRANKIDGLSVQVYCLTPSELDFREV